MKLSKISAIATSLGISVALALSWGCSSTTKKTGFSKAEDLRRLDVGVISNSRQITFEGARAGEGYFSQDGKNFVFQSERHPGNPFYQIYLMNLQSGAIQKLSPGQGKTTCAWIHPDNKQVLFSSTHLDRQLDAKAKQEYESRSSNVKQKYSWSYDEYYDIFISDFKGKNLRRLTTAKGYDAEASFSPDGKKILFASNRSGYAEKLSPEEAKLFEQDPSYLMDLYVVDTDGGNLKRLTTTKGYDGGPFYNAQGSMITWRRFAPNGQWAEIMAMNADGTGERQLTNWKKMSWAPYFHPSNKYIIFTSNYLGYSNFELFIVDTEGKKEPVRVSFLEGFDGLPVFSPDGKTLSWTRRNEKGESQIYFADWDHNKALALLGFAPEVLPKKQTDSLKLPSYGDTQKLRDWVYYFASEEMQGRMTGSPQEEIYMKKIEDFFVASGLKNYPGMSAFRHEFAYTSGVELGSQNAMRFVSGPREWNLKLEKDFVPLAVSTNAKIDLSEVAFAGYGIVAESTDKQPEYNAYRDIDVKGKWVLILTDIPEDVPLERRVYLNTFSRIHHKVLVARERGAKGVLVASSNPKDKDKLPKLRFEGEVAGSSLPVIFVSNTVADEILLATGKKLSDWKRDLDKGDLRTVLVKDLKIQAQTELRFTKSKGMSVIGFLPVEGAKETIMLGAHGDHLGRGERGSSLAKGSQVGQIHYGADDNASGMAAMMELVNWGVANQKSLKKNLAFAIWSGEELGVIGSNAFLQAHKHPQLYINMDMIGRLQEALYVQGLGSAKEHRGILERVALKAPQVNMSPSDDPYLPTDAMAFYLKSIPIISLFTGAHQEYHTPADRPETLNYDGLFRIKNLVTEVLQEYQTAKTTYVKVEGSQKQMSGRQFRLYLGTIPDYGGDGVKGVKISGTTKSSPAEKAGLQPGDILIEMAGRKIDNIYDYVYLLQAMKANEAVDVKILRSGGEKVLKITPALKE